MDKENPAITRFTNATHQAAYKARKRAAGYVLRAFWIPKDKAEQVKAYIKSLEP